MSLEYVFHVDEGKVILVLPEGLSAQSVGFLQEWGDLILKRLRTEAQQGSLTEAAQALGHKGGLKGGAARAASLSPERRSEIARMGAEAANARKREQAPENGEQSPTDSPAP